MPQRAKVSVVVPVYNRAELMIETLDSIFANSHRPLDVVVVDDGSTDGSAQTAEAWAARRRAPGFDVQVVSKPNGGLSSARNAGIAAASGSYVSFLDSDDLIHPTMIETLVDALEGSGLLFAYGRTEVVTIDGQPITVMGKRLRAWPGSIVDHCWHVSAMLVARRVLQDTGGYREDLPRDEDWELDTRIKAACKQGAFVDQVVSSYRFHAGPQLVKDRTRYPQTREISLQRVVATLRSLPADCRRPIGECGTQMFRNALLYHQGGDLQGYKRCRAIALGWCGPLQRLAIRTASAVGPRPVNRMALLKRTVRRALVVLVRSANIRILSKVGL